MLLRVSSEVTSRARPKSRMRTLPGRREHHVGRLHVPVDDARLVRKRERIADIDDDADLLRERQRLAGAHPHVEGLPLDVLHRDVRLAAVFAEVEDGDDVAVGEPARRASLAEEPLAVLGLIDQLRGDHLDGHRALDLRIERAIDDAHPALTEALENLVAADRADVHRCWRARG